MSDTIKWDRSEVINGKRVRTIAFQDHIRATPLIDTDNKRMELITYEGGELVVLAEAKRARRTWIVSVFTETTPGRSRIVKRDRPIHRFELTKAEAIDFMCQNA